MIKKIIYNRPLFYASFIVILIGISSVWSNFEEKRAYTKGINVYALVIEQPNDCENLNHTTSYIKLEYDKHVYIKKVGQAYCDNLGESQIMVRIDKKSNSLFFIGETFDDQIIFSFIILLIGIVIAFKGSKE